MQRCGLSRDAWWTLLGILFFLLWSSVSYAQGSWDFLSSNGQGLVTPNSFGFEKKKEITIAILQDGPSAHLDKLVQEIESQTKHLMGEEKKLTFVKKPYNAKWNAKAVPGLLASALNNPEIDIILAVGILSTQAAASPTRLLNKPVIGTLIDRSEILTMPISSEGKSSKKNFTFVVLNLPISRDFEVFHEMIEFKTVHVLVDKLVYGNLKGIAEKKSQLEKELGIQIKIVKGGDSAEGFLNQLGTNTEAVLFGSLSRLSDVQLKRLIQGLNQRKIPSFASVGYTEVEMGALAGLIPDTFDRTARRAALDLQQIMLDFPADDLSVMMPIQSRLLINAKTASQIGYSPDFIILRTANFTQSEWLKKGEALTLGQAIQMAGRSNVDLTISQAETDVSQQQSLIQRSFLIPQADGSIRYTEVDRDRAVASLGILPQRETRGNLNFSTVVFDDPLLSDFRRSRKLYKSATYLNEATRLDVMLEGGRRFINLLSTAALLRIEAENLTLTQENLEMARMRFEVGMAGLDEVYRWEAQEAQQRGLVFTRVAEVSNALVALNQVLNVDQAKEWKPVDIARQEAQGYFFGDRFQKILKNLKDYKIFEEKLVSIAFQNSPTLKAIAQQKQGEGIRLNQRKRRFYTPSLGATFDYSRRFQTTRPGQTLPAQSDRDDWAFSGQVSLPIFQGGLRVHQMNESKAELMRIGGEYTRGMQLLEQAARSELNDVSASGPNLYFTRRAADRAKLNLGIVKEKYAQGKVGIIDLIDAQNEFVNREQEAAIAVYQYLLDLLEVQRSISWFALEHSDAEIQAFVDDIELYMKHGGNPPNTSEMQVEKTLNENSK